MRRTASNTSRRPARPLRGHLNDASRLPRLASALFALCLVALALLVGFTAPVARSDTLGGSWTPNTSLPQALFGLSCVASPDYGTIFCTGGANGNGVSDQVYASTFSSSGAVGGWTASNYPTQIEYQSCVRFLSSLYCIGGTQGAYRFASDSQYANLTTTGLGKWVAAAFYPVGTDQQSCATYLTYVYCVGGTTSFGVQNSTYFSALTPKGITLWKATAPYPLKVAGASCAAYIGYIYCVGGFNATSGVSNVYSAPISSSGIGAWGKTTSYPAPVYSQSCAAYSAHLYCVGGTIHAQGHSPSYSNAVYVAPLLGSNGVGPWVQTTSYPTSVEGESCLILSGYLDCFGGYDGTSASSLGYYAPIVAITTTTQTSYITETVTSTNTTTSTITSYSETGATVTVALETVTVKSVSTRTSVSTTVSTSVLTSTVTGPPGPAQTSVWSEVALGVGVALILVSVEMQVMRIRRRAHGRGAPG